MESCCPQYVREVTGFTHVGRKLSCMYYQTGNIVIDLGGGIICTTIGASGSFALSDTYRLLRFGVFELNLELEELRKNGSVIKLPPQPFRLLVMLASRSGQIVTRDEIQQQLWGRDTFIDFEQGVNKCIKQIRTALGDNADNPLYLETIPRHGYRFLAPVRTKIVPAPPPQVKEASSGLIANVAGEVRSRVGIPMQSATPIDVERSKTREVPPEASAQRDASPQRHGSPIFWVLASLTILLVVIVYWVLWQGPR
jgi:DNA-binding winged helix-turn-helix (wHTH) protein